MRDIGLTVYSLLVIWVTGFLLIRRFALFRGQPPSFVYGAALGIGGGVLSLVILVASGVGGSLRLMWGYLVLFGVALLSARYPREEKPGAMPSGVQERIRIPEVCLLGVLALIVLAMIASGAFGELGGDGWAIWAFKAKVFFLGRGVDLAFLRDETRFGFAHLDYPLLLPLVEWWVYAHLGHVNDSVVRLVHVGFYLSLLAAFYGSLRTFVGRQTALLCTVVLGLLAPGVTNTLDGYADLIQGYYALLGFVSFVAWVNGGQPSDLVSAGVSLALGSHVKAEGATWLLAITASIVLALWHVRRELSAHVRPLRTFLAIGVPVAGTWPLYRWVFDIPLSPVVMLPTFDLVVSRLPVILRALLGEFSLRGFWQSGWGLMWVFTLLGCFRAAAHRSPSRRQILCCWSPLVFQGLIVSVVYLLTVAPLKWHLATSLTRVLLQFAPCCLWAGAATLLAPDPFKPSRGIEDHQLS
jgi:hypothetical protein